jgi:hypothetical protein
VSTSRNERKGGKSGVVLSRFPYERLRPTSRFDGALYSLPLLSVKGPSPTFAPIFTLSHDFHLPVVVFHLPCK